jgi:hypothetical protein
VCEAKARGEKGVLNGTPSLMSDDAPLGFEAVMPTNGPTLISARKLISWRARRRG